MAPRDYHKLSHSDALKVLQDENAREAYLDGLALIDDFICGFGPDPVPARNPDVDDIRKDLTGVAKALSGQASLANNVNTNSVVAQELRKEAERLGAMGEGTFVENAIGRFRNGLLDQYRGIISTY